MLLLYFCLIFVDLLCFLVEYTAAIECIPSGHPFSVALLNNRAVCYLKANIYKPCIADCTSVLSISPDYVKATLRRAQAYEATEQLELALNDFKTVVAIDATQRMAFEGVQRMQKGTLLVEGGICGEW